MLKSGCEQSGFWTLKLTVSQKLTEKINCFFWHADTNSGKLKLDSVIFG